MFLSTDAFICMYMCICVYVCVCMYVCMYVCKYTPLLQSSGCMLYTPLESKLYQPICLTKYCGTAAVYLYQY